MNLKMVRAPPAMGGGCVADDAAAAPADSEESELRAIVAAAHLRCSWCGRGGGA